VAEAVAIAVIKEHVAALITGNGAARSSRVAPLPSHTVVLGSAPPSSQETKPSLPAFPQGSAAKPQGLGSCRHTAWFSETSHCSPFGSGEKSPPPAFENWSSQLTDDSLPLILESHGQQHPPSLRSWRSVSDEPTTASSVRLSGTGGLTRGSNGTGSRCPTSSWRYRPVLRCCSSASGWLSRLSTVSSNPRGATPAGRASR